MVQTKTGRKLSYIQAVNESLRIAMEADPNVIVMGEDIACLLYTSPSPRDTERSRMPSSA